MFYFSCDVLKAVELVRSCLNILIVYFFISIQLTFLLQRTFARWRIQSCLGRVGRHQRNILQFIINDLNKGNLPLLDINDLYELRANAKLSIVETIIFLMTFIQFSFSFSESCNVLWALISLLRC